MERRLALALLVPTLGACHVPAATTMPAQVLPLRRLELYETGVGYFERRGAVSTAAETTLPVPAGHLDDALKTLVVLGGGSAGHVEGIEFSSSVSKGMARSLAGLPLDAETPITYHDLLGSLRGAAVEIITGEGRVTGRLVDVLRGGGARPSGEAKGEAGGEGKPAATGPGDERELTLLVLTDQSQIRRFASAEVRSVRPTDAALAARLASALEALGARGAQTRRPLRLLARTSEPVTLGYIAESPVWRTTYRLVLGDAGATLQAWALLHNDTDEDWSGVEVRLASGRPDSFLFPLAAPRYYQRELVPPQVALSTVPQLSGATVDALWGDHIAGTQIGEAYGAGGLGLVGTGQGGGGSGEGTIGLGRVGTVGHGGGSGGAAGDSSLLAVGNLTGVTQAQGVEAGALFTYTLGRPLALHAHGSALVPFLARPIDVVSISRVRTPGSAARAAVRLVNSTGQTLPAGPISFFAGGGFAGESGLDRLKPGERRFIDFGTDLDLELTLASTRSAEETRRLSFADDLLEEHFLRRSDLVYRIENKSGRPREVYLALSLSRNATFTGADQLDYDAVAEQPVAIFRVAAHKKLERPARTEEGLSRKTRLDALTGQRLAELAALATLPQDDRAPVLEAAARQRELEQTRAALEKARAEAGSIDKDLDRLREHLKALGGGEARQLVAQNPFVQRILAAEDRRAALRLKLEALEGERERRQDAVRQSLARLKREIPARP